MLKNKNKQELKTNVTKKESALYRLQTIVRSSLFSKIPNYYKIFKGRKNDKQFKRLLEESKPLIDLYITAAYLQKTNGKLPITLEEYEKNQVGHFPYEIFFSTEIYPNQLKYKLNKMEFKPYSYETLYEFIYDSNTKSLIIENKS